MYPPINLSLDTGCNQRRDEEALISQEEHPEKDPAESCQPPAFLAVGRGSASVLKGGSGGLSTTSTTRMLLILVTEVARLLKASLR